MCTNVFFMCSYYILSVHSRKGLLHAIFDLIESLVKIILFCLALCYGDRNTGHGHGEMGTEGRGGGR